MTASILQFPNPGNEPFTIGKCIAFADMFCEDSLLSNAQHMLWYAKEATADGRVGAAIAAMII